MKSTLLPWIQRGANLEKIHRLYFDEKKSMKEISIIVNIPTTSLFRWANALGWILRGQHPGGKPIFVPFENLSYEKDSITIKRQLIALRGHRCELCDYNKYVEVHHIIPRRFGECNLPENLILLCPNHHREADYGFLVLDHFKSGSNRGNLNKVLEYLRRGNPEGNGSLTLHSVETSINNRGQEYSHQIERWLETVKMPDTVKDSKLIVSNTVKV